MVETLAPLVWAVMVVTETKYTSTSRTAMQRSPSLTRRQTAVMAAMVLQEVKVEQVFPKTVTVALAQMAARVATAASPV